MEIRRSYDRLTSTMGFPILVRWHLYIESGPRALFSVRYQNTYMTLWLKNELWLKNGRI